ncbi:MAG: hypothetical protein ACUZ8H_02710 [Candidatus Anammoxibacter sp.]
MPNLNPSLAEGEKKDILVYEKSRKCIKDSCQKELSIYNPGPTCHTHAAWWVDKKDKKKEKELVIREAKYKKDKLSTA